MVRIHQGALLEIKPFEGVWTTSVRILLSKPRAPWRPLMERVGLSCHGRLPRWRGWSGAFWIALALQAQSTLRRLVKRAKRGRGPQQTPRASAVARITPGRCALFSTACQIGQEANYHPFRRTGSGPRHLARTQKGFALRWQARTAKPPIRIACGCCWSAGSPGGLGCINCKACLIWAED